jgi:predicted transcriptional regulator
MTAAPTKPRDEVRVALFVEHLAMLFESYGVPRMPARVLMVMMADDDAAMTAAELAQRLGVSPAAISGAVRYLVHIGLIEREPVPGSRRDRYRLPEHAWYEASATKTTFLGAIAGMADEGVTALGERTPAGARVAEMRDFFLFIQSEFDAMLERWRSTRAVPARGGRRQASAASTSASSKKATAVRASAAP